MTEQPTSNFDSERKNVGEGWQKLIEFVHFYVSKLDPDYEVLQIKEKFGGLRYYHANSPGLDEDDKQICNGIIDMAEQLSFLICEECGEHGRVVRIDNWLKTLCEKHQEERRASREQNVAEMSRLIDAKRKSAQSRPN